VVENNDVVVDVVVVVVVLMVVVVEVVVVVTLVVCDVDVGVPELDLVVVVDEEDPIVRDIVELEDAVDVVVVVGFEVLV